MPAAKRPMAKLSNADMVWFLPEILPFTKPIRKKAKAVRTKEAEKALRLKNPLRGEKTKENSGINPTKIKEIKVARPVLSGSSEDSLRRSFLDLVER